LQSSLPLKWGEDFIPRKYEVPHLLGKSRSAANTESSCLKGEGRSRQF